MYNIKPFFALPFCTNYSTDLLHISHAQCAFIPLQQTLPIYCTALHPSKLFNFFRGLVENLRQFYYIPRFCTTIVHKLLYRFTPYFPCTMRIHSPTRHTTHLLYCTTPLKIIQLFSRLGRKFTTILLHSPFFALPFCTNYSTDLLHISHAQCAFIPLQQTLPIYPWVV